VTGDAAVVLAALIPSHPQYERLRTAMMRYRQIVADGGWPEIHPRKLPMEYGARGDEVAALQKRLAIEGYYKGEVTSHFDGDTRRAVVEYQKSHQLGHNGILEEDDIRSLNYSADKRLAQIEATLDRWRDT